MSITTPKETIKEDADKPFCCKFCGSENYIKYGIRYDKQNYMCKDCGKKFVDNQYFEYLKVNPKIICATLDLYFKGISLRKISDHLKQFYDLDIHFTTIYYWIKRYIEIMDNYVSQFKPKLGTVWQVDEMMVQVDGDWFYLWNVMDEFTRFHLASVISKERKIKDARKAFQKAKKASHNDKPRCIVTDGLQTYKKAINKEFHTVKKETIHIGNVGIKGKHFKNAKFDNNLVERLHGTVRDRNKTQRGLKSEETTFVKGHQLYYNFIKPHEALNSYTPAHFANIYLNLNNHKWENLLTQSIKNQKTKKKF
jgi:transposase-like protein